MLKIYYGSLPDEVKSASVYFDFNFELDWLDNELNREMIKDIDKSEVIAGNMIKSSVLGIIPPQWLSGGVKALICMNSDTSGLIFNLSNCGDNCAKWVYEIAKHKDLLVTTHHTMSFRGIDDFEVEMVNSGKIVDYEGYLDEIAEIESE